MRIAGIDIGSRTIKLVVLEDGELRTQQVTDSTYDPIHVCRRLLGETDHEHLVATGYGRHLFRQYWPGAELLTEIKAVGLGARALLPSCRTIVDVGGQDTKAVALDRRGGLAKFTMNDRCAAGTGRFLEVMAHALSYRPSDFVAAAERATRAERLNSTCAVFTETEVISAVARGAAREELALGIHESVASRTASLLRAVPVEDDVLFAGGGARNGCLRRLVERTIGRTLHVPAEPQIVTALGAALYGAAKRVTGLAGRDASVRH